MVYLQHFLQYNIIFSFANDVFTGISPILAILNILTQKIINSNYIEFLNKFSQFLPYYKLFKFLAIFSIFTIVLVVDHFLRKKLHYYTMIIYICGICFVVFLTIFSTHFKSFTTTTNFFFHNNIKLIKSINIFAIISIKLFIYTFIFLGNHINFIYLESKYSKYFIARNLLLSIVFTMNNFYSKLTILFALSLFIYNLYPYLASKGGNSTSFAQIKGSKLIYSLVKYTAYLLLKFYNRFEFYNSNNCPSSGAVIIVANHSSALDGFFIGCCLNREINTMVKQESFENPFTSWFLRKVNSFPVDRFKPDPSAFKTSIKILTNGEILTLFPEGTRNPNGKIKPFKPGAIRLAIKLKVPILPAFIDGNHLINPPKSMFPRPYKLRVMFGSVIDTSSLLQEGKTEDEISQITYSEVVKLGTHLRKEDVRDFS